LTPLDKVICSWNRKNPGGKGEMIVIRRQLFCDKKDNPTRILSSIRRYMGLILLYYKNKGIKEDDK